MSARTAAAAVPGPRRSPESKGKRTPAVGTSRRLLVPGAVNVVHVDFSAHNLPGIHAFVVVDAELGTLAVVDSRLDPAVRKEVANKLLRQMDGRSAPAFEWGPALAEALADGAEDGAR